MGDVKLLLASALADLDLAAPTAGAPRRWPALALAAGAALLAAGATWWWSRPAEPVASAPVLRQVTNTGGLNDYPALSRDGNLLAFASDRNEAGNLDIWVQQIGGRDPIRLTADDADDSEPAISADGTRVAFRSERSGGGIYVVPSLGGDAVLLAPRGRGPRFSPDGHWIAYWEGRESSDLLPGTARVFVIESGGGQARQIGADLPRLSAAAFDHENARRTGQQVGTFAALPVGDPAPVGRKARAAAAGGEQHGIATQRRHHVDAAAGAFTAEGHAGAIGGEGGLAVVGLVGSQADGVASADLLHPDIEVAGLVAVAGKGQQVAVARERRVVAEPARIGDLAQHRNRRDGFGGAEPPPGGD